MSLKILALLVAIVTVAGTAVAADWEGKEATKDGVLHVMNPAGAMERISRNRCSRKASSIRVSILLQVKRGGAPVERTSPCPSLS